MDTIAVFVPSGLNDWLAHGERGISSEAIVSKLSGINLVGRWGLLPPADPADFRRCELLLRAVPEFRERLHEMANVSSHWARLVERWDDLVATLEAEAPGWTSPYSRWHASKTYALMKSLEREPGDTP